MLVKLIGLGLLKSWRMKRELKISFKEWPQILKQV